VLFIEAPDFRIRCRRSVRLGLNKDRRSDGGGSSTADARGMPLDAKVALLAAALIYSNWVWSRRLTRLKTSEEGPREDEAVCAC